MTTNDKTIILRKPEEEDLDLALEWIKEENYYYFLTGAEDSSAINLRETVLKQFSAPSNYDSNIYLVIEKEEGAPLGMILFHSINWKNRNGFMEIYLPDTSEYNLCLDAYLAAIDFAFQELNLHKICFYLFADKDKFVNIAEKAGAKREQVLRKHFVYKKKFYDVYVYGLLRREYEEMKTGNHF